MQCTRYGIHTLMGITGQVICRQHAKSSIKWFVLLFMMEDFLFAEKRKLKIIFILFADERKLKINRDTSKYSYKNISTYILWSQNSVKMDVLNVNIKYLYILYSVIVFFFFFFFKDIHHSKLKALSHQGFFHQFSTLLLFFLFFRHPHQLLRKLPINMQSIIIIFIIGTAVFFHQFSELNGILYL